MISAEVNRERFAIKKSYSIENGYPSRRRSLVGDAKFESAIKKQQKQSLIAEARRQSFELDLVEEELFLLASSEEEIQRVILILRLPGGIASLPRIIKTVENFKGTLKHVESRISKVNGGSQEILLRLEMEKEPLKNLLSSLRQGSSTSRITLLADDTIMEKDAWFPTHVSELDMCNHLVTKYEPDLDMQHPGFCDKVYRERRSKIAEIAFTYKHGQEIPRIPYRPEDIETWAAVYKEIDKLVPTHACQEFKKVWNLLKRESLYSETFIPQLQDVSDFMKRKTGFTLRPAAGLLTARDFLASLAFRVFQCTQYVRHHTSPHHSPEPDVIHELLGHAPLLADPAFASFSHELGLASLGATDDEIEKFATMYWFTVEFGLCKENGQLRAWGAGLLSSFGELQHALSDKPEQREFNPSTTAVQPYQDQDYQDLYFVAESVEDAQLKFRKWVTETMHRKYEVRYNPFSQSIQILNGAEHLKQYVSQISSDVDKLRSAVNKLYF